MAVSPVSISLTSERLDLIRLIARNIVGERTGPNLPPFTGGTGPMTMPQRAGEAERAREAYSGTAPSHQDALQDEHAVDRSRTAPAAHGLSGLRPPLATVVQPSAYAAAMARLAASLADKTASAGKGTAAPPAENLPAESEAGPHAAAASRAVRPGDARLAAMLKAGEDTASATSPEEADSATAAERAKLTEARAVGAAAARAALASAGTAATDWRSQAVADGSATAAPDASADPMHDSAQARGAADAATAGSASASRSEAAGTDRTQSLAYFLSPDAGEADRLSQELSSALASIRNLASADRGVQSAMVERSLLALGLGEAAAATASPLPERAGVIASFILNAHFQPGWPPLRPIQDVEAKAFVMQAAPAAKLAQEEIDVLLYLANFGLNKEQLSRIMKLIMVARRRSKLLDAIASFFSNFGTLMSTLQEELEFLVEDLAERRLSPATAGKRSRIDLR